jgi:hypothetical protein
MFRLIDWALEWDNFRRIVFVLWVIAFSLSVAWILHGCSGG